VVVTPRAPGSTVIIGTRWAFRRDQPTTSTVGFPAAT
jgi:hypothetical protein